MKNKFSKCSSVPNRIHAKMNRPKRPCKQALKPLGCSRSRAASFSQGSVTNEIISRGNKAIPNRYLGMFGCWGQSWKYTRPVDGWWVQKLPLKGCRTRLHVGGKGVYEPNIVRATVKAVHITAAATVTSRPLVFTLLSLPI